MAPPSPRDARRAPAARALRARPVGDRTRLVRPGGCGTVFGAQEDILRRLVPEGRLLALALHPSGRVLLCSPRSARCAARTILFHPRRVFHACRAFATSARRIRNLLT